MTREERKDLINALSLIDVAQTWELDAINDAISELDKEPCEDAVSRQAVYEILEGNWNTDFLHAEVEKLPSVQPKQKMGVWITERWNNKEHYSCSNCLHIVDYEPCYHYCPYCGAELKGGE